MTSRDFCIVHLSDLHFKKGSNRLVFQRLLKDVGSQICNDEAVVFAVTGDIGSKSVVRECKEHILHFFKSLRDVVPKKVKIVHLLMVPGNHDGKRPDLSNNYNDGSYLLDLRDYDDIEKSVCAIFNSCHEGDMSQEQKVLHSMEWNGRRIVFVKLNSSSFESGDRLRNQISGDLKSQGPVQEKDVDALVEMFSDKFRESFKKQCGEAYRMFQEDMDAHNHSSPDLTILLAHHPLAVINTSNVDDTEESLYKSNLEFGDMWLSGHTHISQQSFFSYNNRQRMMLATGIGWQETSHEEMRYSIYRVNFERGTCQVVVRSATANKDFGAHRHVGSNDEFELHKHETLPLKLDSVGAAIHSNSAIGGHRRSLYVDTQVVEEIPRILNNISIEGVVLRQKISGIEHEQLALLKKANLCKRIYYGVVYKDDSLLKVRQQVTRDRKIFYDVIYSVCQSVARILESATKPLKTEDKNGEVQDDCQILWRVHARVYRGKNSDHIREKFDSYNAIYSCDEQGDKADLPKRVDWGGVIKQAFSHEPKVLIDSANPFVNETTTDWSDFMTIIPSNVVLQKKDKKELRPLLSFGISFKTDNSTSLKIATRTLYLLEYLGVQRLIDNALNLFFDRYEITKKEIVRII